MTTALAVRPRGRDHRDVDRSRCHAICGTRPFALGDDLDELLEHLDVRPEAIIDAGSDAQGIAGVYNVGGGPTSAPR